METYEYEQGRILQTLPFNSYYINGMNITMRLKGWSWRSALKSSGRVGQEILRQFGGEFDAISVEKADEILKILTKLMISSGKIKAITKLEYKMNKPLTNKDLKDDKINVG